MNNIYQDIAQRSGGDVYIGVVGPVRTGKSTFIKKFMDLLVIPNIDDERKRERAVDELPQSAQGITIMTTEPKFIPNEAVEVTLDGNAKMNVRMIDCVGYIVPNSAGYIEADMPRMVTTPWFDHEIPFEQAAEIGTKKVITDHSSIGLVVTTDGSITELDRSDYTDAEARVISELKAINKPFVIVLNTKYPTSEQSKTLAAEMQEQYGVPVVPVNCSTMNIDDINAILSCVLYEFPVTEVSVVLPSWINALPPQHPLRQSMLCCVKDCAGGVDSIRSVKNLGVDICENEYVKSADVSEIRLGTGEAFVTVVLNDGIFYRMLSESSGFEIHNDCELMQILNEMGTVKREYDKIYPAMQAVKQKGYGIISPTIDELSLEEPEIVKQGSRYGVRLRASAPSIHLIRADIETEVSPVVGTEKQSEELVQYLLNDFNDDPAKIWDSNIFGKSLNELVNEGLHNKLSRMPEDAQFKLQETLQKIINEGSGGLICLIL